MHHKKILTTAVCITIALATVGGIYAISKFPRSYKSQTKSNIAKLNSAIGAHKLVYTDSFDAVKHSNWLFPSKVHHQPAGTQNYYAVDTMNQDKFFSIALQAKKYGWLFQDGTPLTKENIPSASSGVYTISDNSEVITLYNPKSKKREDLIISYFKAPIENNLGVKDNYVKFSEPVNLEIATYIDVY